MTDTIAIRPCNTLIIDRGVPLHPDAVLEVCRFPEGQPLTDAPRNDDGLIEVCSANSGGFVKLAPPEDIITRFRVVSREEWRELLQGNWRLVKVGFESESLQNMDAWWSGQRWNGWICPIMTVEQFEAMVPKWNANDDQPMRTYADGGVSPPEYWCLFDTITDPDGTKRYYHIGGQEGERRYDGKWYYCADYDADVTDENGEHWKLKPRDQWEEIETIGPFEMELPGLGKVPVIDVSCGLCWEIDYDPAEPPTDE